MLACSVSPDKQVYTDGIHSHSNLRDSIKQRPVLCSFQVQWAPGIFLGRMISSSAADLVAVLTSSPPPSAMFQEDGDWERTFQSLGPEGILSPPFPFHWKGLVIGPRPTAGD